MNSFYQKILNYSKKFLCTSSHWCVKWKHFLFLLNINFKKLLQGGGQLTEFFSIFVLTESLFSLCVKDDLCIVSAVLPDRCSVHGLYQLVVMGGDPHSTWEGRGAVSVFCVLQVVSQ